MTSDPLSRYLVNRTSRVNRRERMRVMTSNEVIDMALAVYQSLGWTILRLTAVPSVVALAAIAFVLEYVLPSFGLTNHPGSVTAQVGEAAVTMAVGLGIGGPLFLLGLSYSTGVVVSLAADFMLGRIPSPESAVAAGRRAVKGLFLMSLYELLVGWSGVIIATVLLMFSAITSESGSSGGYAFAASWLAVIGYTFGWIALPLVLVRHALAPAVVVIEGMGAAKAAKRSVALMKGTPWQPSGFGAAWLLVTSIVILLVLLIPGISGTLEFTGLTEQLRIFTNIPFLSQTIAQAMRGLPYFLAIWTLVPVWCAGITVLYFERRVRLEGFDIETLAQDVWRTDRRSRFEL